MIEVSICRTCGQMLRVLNNFGECQDCTVKRAAQDTRVPPGREALEQIKTELLAWAGLHRGKAISEDAMPRFHEIIDRLDAIMQRTI